LLGRSYLRGVGGLNFLRFPSLIVAKEFQAGTRGPIDVDLEIGEYLAPSPPSLTPAKIDEADRLNGVEWSGVSRLAVSSYRKIRRDPRSRESETWGDAKWRNGSTLTGISNEPPSLEMVKTKHKGWTVTLDARHLNATYLIDLLGVGQYAGAKHASLVNMSCDAITGADPLR
jgi:hypothetical protein